MENTNNYYVKYYEKIGNEYNNIRLDVKNDMENVINIIKKYLNQKKAEILDIGCGTGKYGKLMQENGYKVIGIDKSETQITQAKKLIESYVADATNLPFDNNTFDACIMIIMIQQLSKGERIKAFSEAHRVLKNGGILIIKTYSHNDLTYRFADRFFPKVLELDKTRYPEIDELKNELYIFSNIKVENSSIIVETSKAKYIERFKKRGSSNLSFLTDDEISEGIEKLEETFKGTDVIKKTNNNTFIIARKD